MSHRVRSQQLLSRGRAAQSIQPLFHLTTLMPLSLPDLPLLLLPNPPLRLFFTNLRSPTVLYNPPDDFTAKTGHLYSPPLWRALDKPKCDSCKITFLLDTETIVSTLADLVHPLLPILLTVVSEKPDPAQPKPLGLYMAGKCLLTLPFLVLPCCPIPSQVEIACLNFRSILKTP